MIEYSYNNPKRPIVIKYRGRSVGCAKSSPPLTTLVWRRYSGEARRKNSIWPERRNYSKEDMCLQAQSAHRDIPHPTHRNHQIPIHARGGNGANTGLFRKRGASQRARKTKRAPADISSDRNNSPHRVFRLL